MPARLDGTRWLFRRRRFEAVDADGRLRKVFEILVVVAGEVLHSAAATGTGVVGSAVCAALEALEDLEVFAPVAFAFRTEPVILQVPLAGALVGEAVAVAAVPSGDIGSFGKLIIHFFISRHFATHMTVTLLRPEGDMHWGPLNIFSSRHPKVRRGRATPSTRIHTQKFLFVGPFIVDHDVFHERATWFLYEEVDLRFLL